ncbi:unnamed protein product [Cercopithifilaria johnstoni]|uniref:Uncharacterized protein n=1 Tax=Cercopithifilaria johnstoni TaxID=2874296 RepID=A0A8J2MRU4_9BILA|nr:unnamed protein product [Cercopithifilaria johnstoni]
MRQFMFPYSMQNRRFASRLLPHLPPTASPILICNYHHSKSAGRKLSTNLQRCHCNGSSVVWRSPVQCSAARRSVASKFLSILCPL